MQVRLPAKKLTISQYMGHVSKSSYDADDKTELLNLLNPQAQAKSAAPVKPTRFSSLDEEEEVVMCVVTSQQIFGRPTMPEIEKPFFYRVCGYILKKLKDENPSFDACIPCTLVCTWTFVDPHKYGNFPRTTNFVQGALIEVSDDVFQLLLAVEERISPMDKLLYTLESDLLTLLQDKVCDIQVPETSPPAASMPRHSKDAGEEISSNAV